MEQFVWIWLLTLAFSIIAEVITEKLIAVFGIPASVVSIVFSLCNIHIVYQIIAFVLIFALGAIGVRYLVGRYKSQAHGGIDAVIGEKCVVCERIDNFAGQGLVKIKGLVWSARGVGEDDIFEIGESLTVVAVEGVKLICKK